MSEHEDLFAVYGAIDRAVQKRPDLAATVGRYLPGYKGGDSIGWFDDFVAFTRRHAPAADFPPPHVALARMAGKPTSGRMAARRLHALAVAARVHEHLGVRDAKTAIVNAHGVDGIRATGKQATNDKLFALLTDDSVFGKIEDWPQLIEQGVGSGVLSSDLQVHGAASPCVGNLVDVHTPGDEFPAAELRTWFDTDAVTAPQAERFLEPSNWPAASTFWCLMEPGPTTARGTRIYHEIVSLNCKTREENKTWTAEAYLEFAFVRTGNIARVSYQLDLEHANPQIDVDEGALTVQHLDDHIHVETVKRIRFTYPFNGPSLAMVMCAIGYASVAKELVLDCAVQHKGSDEAGTAFPGTNPPEKVQPRPGPATRRPPLRGRPRDGATAAKPSPPQKTPSSGSPNPGAPNPGTPAATPTDVMHDAVGALQQSLHDCVDAYDAMYTKFQSGKITANDVVGGYGDMLSRYVRDGTTAFGHSMRMARAVRDAYPATPAAAPPANAAAPSSPAPTPTATTAPAPEPAPEKGDER